MLNNLHNVDFIFNMYFLRICFCAIVLPSVSIRGVKMDFLRKFRLKGPCEGCQLGSEETLPKCTVHSCLNHFHLENPSCSSRDTLRSNCQLSTQDVKN